MKLKDACSLEESYDEPRYHIKKQIHYFADKGLSSQCYDFSSGHVWMWELDYKESWVLKNWCFWTVVLEKTLESPLDWKEIQPVNPRENQSWMFFARTDAEVEAPILWPPDAKNWLIGKDPDAGKDWRQEEKGMTEDEMVGWHHWLDEHEFEQGLGVGDGERSMACCSPWSYKESHMTEHLTWIYFTRFLFLVIENMIQVCLYQYLFSVKSSMLNILDYRIKIPYEICKDLRKAIVISNPNKESFILKTQIFSPLMIKISENYFIPILRAWYTHLRMELSYL